MQEREFVLHALRDMKGGRTTVVTYINQAISLSRQFKKSELVDQLGRLLDDVSKSALPRGESPLKH
jgi:hypothetical protein